MCSNGIDPIDMKQDFLLQRDLGGRLERVFRCPRQTCEQFFIGRYYQRNRHTGIYYLAECVPHEPVNTGFHNVITEVSPSFCEIYNEASKAEQYGLKLVAGAGYRKSLEFLIKDYLIRLKPEDEEAIKKQPLAACIKERVPNQNVVTTATRAAWLGNDEIHYERKWEGKDVDDLKILIQLTVRWIEMEELTKQTAEEMPEPKKASAS